MSVNFNKIDCQDITTLILFAICDDNDENPAYVVESTNSNSIVTVRNAKERKVTFTAIDKCVFTNNENGLDTKRCDCMLTYTHNIVFIELKDQRKEWISDAIDQLESTINSYKESHDITVFKHKRAFAANKRHPNFHVIDDEKMKKFFDEHKVRLNVQSEIIIK